MSAENVFERLSDATNKVREGLTTILDIAPNLKLYKTLIENENNPFLQSTIKTEGLSLSASEIKFAVSVKELFDEGELDVVGKVISGEIDDLWNYVEEKCTKKEETVSTEEVEMIDEVSTEDQIIKSEPVLEVVHKRNRVFDVFKDDNPPPLPVINEPQLLAKVFTHQSIISSLNISEEDKVKTHNERLEFLGDAFLQFLTTMIIYERFPHFNEGQLSILRSKIVSNNRLLKLSQIYKFDKQLKKNFNETAILTGNNKLYADVFEAYLGAIADQYMLESVDGETRTDTFLKGWFEAKEWIEELCEEQLRTFDPSIVFKMQYSKSGKQDLRLLVGQEIVPIYIRCDLPGRRMLSCVKIGSKVYGYGIGTSNKEADSRAAVDAMSNPGLKKICPTELWNKFEESIGLNENGGLRFNQYDTPITESELGILEKAMVLKYRHGPLKFLASHNNKKALLVDEEERNRVVKEIEEKFSIENTADEIASGSVEEIKGDDVGELEKTDNADKSHLQALLGVDGEKILNDTIEEISSKIFKPIDLSDSKSTSRGSSSSSFEVKPKKKHYPKQYTMGRGGIFSEEADIVRIGECKVKRGIARNKIYQIIESDIGAEGPNNSNQIREMLCHEVLEKVSEVDMQSKNFINGVYVRRGGTPSYIFYKTINDEYLCELWFGNRQIVGYGLDKNKKLACNAGMEKRRILR
ncbi:hypothetical protein CANINC_002472 [Pichia inconspicua]|uniref:RNase III domain-containing protein n=1 Tax=Pichia inconspicua TaxID=52247 RepID=A0A4T0X161_9ASCO|nr:hypothetical protein CANINC_002472 [[Candida] inconspicua]